MSKLHKPHGRADADTDKGELRKPDDYSNQPGQGGAYTIRETASDKDALAAPRDPGRLPPDVGESSREYGHASGDRNTMDGPRDWRGFEGGKQRDATPGASADAEARRTTRDDRSPSGDNGS